MSAVAGGPPVSLVKPGAGTDYPGSWSPEGNWFVYWHVENGLFSLRKVKTTGQAEPVVLKEDVRGRGGRVPVWSPAGDWILYFETGGARLVSPDGKTTREISATNVIAYAFSADGRSLYGIRRQAADRLELISHEIAKGTEKTIGFLGPEHLPVSSLNPGLRLSLSPDGKSLTYSTVRSTSNLWLMEGMQTAALP
jgi:Tol biopolymer transport system component